MKFQSIWQPPRASPRALVAGVPAQPAGVAQAGHPSLVGNIAEPLMWLVAFGYGMGALVGQVKVVAGWRCPTSCSWPAAASA
jgi:lipooligosaccharide transport system permease protein